MEVNKKLCQLHLKGKRMYWFSLQDTELRGHGGSTSEGSGVEV